jgi:hypothetical protein
MQPVWEWYNSVFGVLESNGIAVSTRTDNQFSPQVASNGTDFLVVWTDDRNSVSSNSDIYGARVSAAGVISDPLGFVITATSAYEGAPSVASAGNDYLVTWTSQASIGGALDIYGSRVTSAGGVSDIPALAICASSGDQDGSSVASNGSQYFVTWYDDRSRGNLDIYGTRVTTSGTIVDTTNIGICTQASTQLYPSAGSNGTDFFVVWQDQRNASADIYGSRVRASDGAVLDAGNLAISTASYTQGRPSVAGNGTDYFIAWYDFRNNVDNNVYGARVTSTGSVTDTTGIAISSASNSQIHPDVVRKRGRLHCRLV